MNSITSLIIKIIGILIYTYVLIKIVFFSQLPISLLQHYIYIFGFIILLIVNIKRKNIFFIIMFIEGLIILFTSLIKII